MALIITILVLTNLEFAIIEKGVSIYSHNALGTILRQTENIVVFSKIEWNSLKDYQHFEKNILNE